MLAGIDPTSGPIYVHGAVHAMNRPTPRRAWRCRRRNMRDTGSKQELVAALIVAPPSRTGDAWLRRFGRVSLALPQAGCVRQRSPDSVVAFDFIAFRPRGLASLLDVVAATGAGVLVTHGYGNHRERWLRRLDALRARPRCRRAGRECVTMRAFTPALWRTRRHNQE